MEINIPVFELAALIFFYQLFKWGFRFLILAGLAKSLSGIKDKANEKIKAVKEFEKNVKEEGEEKL